MKGSCSVVSLVSGAMAPTGHADTHAPQSTHATGSMCSISAVANPGSSGDGWMQFTGQAYTQDPSLQHDWVITWGMFVRRQSSGGGDHVLPLRLTAVAAGPAADPAYPPHELGDRIDQAGIATQHPDIAEHVAQHLPGLGRAEEHFLAHRARDVEFLPERPRCARKCSSARPS